MAKFLSNFPFIIRFTPALASGNLPSCPQTLFRLTVLLPLLLVLFLHSESSVALNKGDHMFL